MVDGYGESEAELVRVTPELCSTWLSKQNHRRKEHFMFSHIFPHISHIIHIYQRWFHICQHDWFSHFMLIPKLIPIFTHFYVSYTSKVHHPKNPSWPLQWKHQTLPMTPPESQNRCSWHPMASQGCLGHIHQVEEESSYFRRSKSRYIMVIPALIVKPYNHRVLKGGCPRGGGDWGTLRIPREDWEP